MQIRVGFVGWRGMVGSVLMERMTEEDNLISEKIFPVFFSTKPGIKGPGGLPVKHSMDIAELEKCQIIVSCQGGEWTEKVYPQLKSHHWKGYWIDAASTMRHNPDSLIVLDPINGETIAAGLEKGIKKFIGGNCTVSLMLMAIHGLVREGLVEWVHSNTYQAASGAGSENMIELLAQMAYLAKATEAAMSKPATTALELDRIVNFQLRGRGMPIANFGAPLALSLIPWIDTPMENGQTREEWKGSAETNRILGLNGADQVRVDGTCVRGPFLRCHSQGLLIKLKKAISLEAAEGLIWNANPWVELVLNEEQATLERLTPAHVSGTLKVAIGRLRISTISPEMIEAFTVGDQLLWGAAEPIRRVLQIVLDTAKF